MGRILRFRRMLLGRTGQRNHEVRISEVYGVSWGNGHPLGSLCAAQCGLSTNHTRIAGKPAKAVYLRSACDCTERGYSLSSPPPVTAINLR